MRPTKKAYEYGIDQCSVLDKALLKEFRAKRAEWIGWLEEDPDHNIWDQIHVIMWSDAAYRSLNEARRFASKASPTSSVNGMMGEFLDRGYVATQVLDICKLTDGGDDVVSLRRLFADIKKHRHLITRENFVAYDGLPYDYAAAWQAHIDALTREQTRQPRWVSTKGPNGWGISEIMHNAFDGLSGIAADKRSPKDLIHKSVFATMATWFEDPVLTKLRTYRNKYLGHAADQKSRQNAPLSNLGFTLDDFSNAQRVVVRIATTIGSQILYDTALGGVVPTPQFDVFQHLQMPVIPAANMQEMGEWWHNHAKERDDWLEERIDLMTGQKTAN